MYSYDESQILVINQFEIFFENSGVSDRELFSLSLVSEVKKKLSSYLQESSEKLCGQPNNFGLNNLKNIESGKLTYIFATISSKKDSKVYIDADLPGDSRVWVNEEPALMNWKEQKKAMTLVNLNQGNNYIIISLFLQKEFILPPYLYLQVYGADIWKRNNLFCSLRGKKEQNDYNVFVRCENQYLNVIVLGPAIEKTEVYLPIMVNQRMINNAQGNYYTLGKEYRILLEADEIKSCIVYTIFPCKIIDCFVDTQYICEVEREALEYLVNNQNDIEIQGRLRQIKGILVTKIEQYFMIYEIQRKLGHDVPFLSIRTPTSIFYLSEIDNTIQEMRVVLPKKGCDKGGYPLAICLSNGWYDSYLFEEQPEKLLVISASGRGVMGGAYINEYAYLEALSLACKYFDINTEYIYLFGKSNGGYAAWTLSLNYPGLAAAIIPISGLPIEDIISNSSNLPIYNVVSDLDLCYMNGKHECIKKILIAYGNYKYIEVRNILHHTISDYKWFNIEEFFLQHRRVNFPEKITFITERNCYLKSFWIRLHGIEKGKKSAKVSAIRKSEYRFEITVEDAKGITISLPPDVNNKTEICINKTEFVYFAPLPENIHYAIEGRKIFQIQQPGPVDITKGIGILGIYRTSMRIVVPDQADNYEISTAKAFASPHSNGYFDWISTTYPIIPYSILDDDDFLHSLILVNLCQSDVTDKFANYLDRNIFVSDNGFLYKEQRYEGEYCIMQVEENPFAKGKYVLSINANNSRLLRRNFLTRKVVIPFFQEGIHPIWNNVAIIFWNGNYFCIREWKEDIVEML